MDEFDIFNHLDKLLQIFEVAKSKIPTLNSSTNYWFTRANGGEFFDSFHIGNYIAIGWNEITLTDLKEQPENSVKEKIKERYNTVKKPGSAYNQMMRFAYNIRINDIVIVPSEAPNNLLVGRVVSEPYTESSEAIASATNICEYSKRIKVTWMGFIYNKDIDPNLYPLVYSGQTITDANDYKKYINRGLYDSYIEEDTMSITFKVKEEEDVSALAYNKFLSSLLEMSELIKEEESEDIVIRTNVQSNGPLELLGDPNVMAIIGMVVETVGLLAGAGLGAYAFKKLLRGGGEVSFNEKSGFNVKFPGEAEVKIKEAEADRIVAETEQIRAETEISKLKTILEIAQSEDVQYAGNKLQVEVPKQIRNALEATIEEMIEVEDSSISDKDVP